MIPDIKIEDYSYPLDDSRIAKYPLQRRDSSKLLIYRDGEIRDSVFRNIADVLPPDSIMVFNNTRVVPARLHFRRESGARIEIFCLEPSAPCEYNLSFASTSECSWKCVIGNAKRWKNDILSYDIPEGHESGLQGMDLRAELLDRKERTGTVRFSWKGGSPFSRVLDLCGRVPIPPYLNRDTEEIDLERYQTLYALHRGSVAAPTAGLHFTDEVLADIDARGIERESVCLHVGAGTFLPVKGNNVSEHPMHREPFSVSLHLLRLLSDTDRPVIAVGTTSIRTLESLYYIGVSIMETGSPTEVEQWAPYNREYSYSRRESLAAIVKYLEDNGLEELRTGTRIIIVPGFKFRITDICVTNFHQPESTLILLVSAFLDGDWKNVYNHALDNGYRFLSYGDSSLLFRNNLNL